MRFLGKWLIWIGGGALLFVDLRPLVQECMAALEHGRGIGPYGVEEWLLKFARPVFVLGVLCAAALPELGGKRKAKAKPAAPTVSGTAPPGARPGAAPPGGAPSASVSPEPTPQPGGEAGPPPIPSAPV